MCKVWAVRLLPRALLKFEKEKDQNFDSTPLSMCLELYYNPLSNMILCSLNEKQGKENLGQKQLSDDMKVEFVGVTKNHG